MWRSTWTKRYCSLKKGISITQHSLHLANVFPCLLSLYMGKHFVQRRTHLSPGSALSTAHAKHSQHLLRLQPHRFSWCLWRRFCFGQQLAWPVGTLRLTPLQNIQKTQHKLHRQDPKGHLHRIIHLPDHQRRITVLQRPHFFQSYSFVNIGECI